MNFFEDVNENTDYTYQCLVYPNITYQCDFEKDSFCIIMGNILKRLVVLRPDIHFTILLPEISPTFELANVEQVIYNQPSYPNTMRCHFDTKALMKIIDWKHKEWDFVYSYLPEHALQLKNLLWNATNINPPIFGYSCYIEIPETTDYEQSMLPHHFSGILAMENCGTNSQAVKDTIIDSARGYLCEDVIENELKDILRPIPRGWDLVECDTKPVQTDTKIIVFNHRPNTYKSYPWFLKQMDKLWEQRQDFKVWVPLADTADREYIYIDSFDRKGYFSELSKCYVGVCAKAKHKGWSNSASDGMAVGVPYVCLNAGYYKEYAGDAGIYFDSDDEFLLQMNSILDNPKQRKATSKKCLKKFKENSWDCAIDKYDQQFVDVQEKLPIMNETETYLTMKNFILKSGSVSKHDILEHMGWGIRIGWSPYRNRLRTESDIRFKRNRYEKI